MSISSPPPNDGTVWDFLRKDWSPLRTTMSQGHHQLGHSQPGTKTAHKEGKRWWRSRRPRASRRGSWEGGSRGEAVVGKGMVRQRRGVAPICPQQLVGSCTGRAWSPMGPRAGSSLPRCRPAEGTGCSCVQLGRLWRRALEDTWQPRTRAVSMWHPLHPPPPPLGRAFRGRAPPPPVPRQQGSEHRPGGHGLCSFFFCFGFVFSIPGTF